MISAQICLGEDDKTPAEKERIGSKRRVELLY